MKILKYILLSSVLVFTNCSDVINVEPESYIVDNGSYTYFVAQNLLLGAYATLREPKNTEWALTEVLSDNTFNNYGSVSTDAKRLKIMEYDTFNYDNGDTGYYLGPYWLATYTSIRAANTVIQGVGYTYSPDTNGLNFTELQISETSAKALAAEACFIRAYNYFNLVRMFGSIPMPYVPFATPRDAYTLPYSSVSDVYKLIITDLKFAVANGLSANYSASSADVGKANKYAAAALLAKVYLTMGDKASAKTQLESIIGTANLGGTNNQASTLYGLESSYATVFSNSSKMGKEILFSIRYSSSNATVGNGFTELFAGGTAQSSPNVRGDNGITEDLYNEFLTSTTDTRKGVTVNALPVTIPQKYYLSKFYSAVTVTGFGANDWPVLRYSDVLLMYAEALGNTATAVKFINLVRTRATATVYPAAAFATDAAFETALLKERRLEFAGENQRMFDLHRFTANSTTGFNIKNVMINYFNNNYATFYSGVAPYTLSDIISKVNNSNFLLKIPTTQTQQ
jgi:hypothetical protein